MEIAVKSIDGSGAALPEEDGELDEVEEGAPAAIVLQLAIADQGQRLDKVLAARLPQHSRSRLQQWITAGHVQVDGQAASIRQTVLGQERVVIAPQAAPEELACQPEAIPLQLVHEDADILVVDKPAGLVVHPAAGNWSGTLLNGLLHHYPALVAVPRAGIVHRLDKDTSGLMVVARTLPAHTALVRQLQARSVQRTYLALAWGEPPASGRIDAAIGRHPRDRVRMAVASHAGAKPAATRFERVATGALAGQTVSLMRCHLETGRTHQIRVHLQSIGHPLVGDPVYGKAHLASVFPRQALHAHRLGLVHPVSGQELGWQAALPQDLQDLLAQAGLHGETGDS